MRRLGRIWRMLWLSYRGQAGDAEALVVRACVARKFSELLGCEQLLGATALARLQHAMTRAPTETSIEKIRGMLR